MTVKEFATRLTALLGDVRNQHACAGTDEGDRMAELVNSVMRAVDLAADEQIAPAAVVSLFRGAA